MQRPDWSLNDCGSDDPAADQGRQSAAEHSAANESKPAPIERL